MDERPDSSQQLMDILLVMDEKGTLQAVSGVKDGELQTKNPLEDIDWNSLAALGVQREQIEGNGMLDQMLRGFQTDKTVRVHFHFDNG